MEMDYKENFRLKEAQKRVKDIRGFYIHALVYAFINIAILVISLRGQGLLSGLADFSTYFTAFSWGIGLFAHWFIVFGPNLFFGKKWEERKIRELMEKEKSKTWE